MTTPKQITMKKIILYSFSGIFLVVAILLSYVKFALPNVSAPENIKIEADAEMLQRGEYLANHVMLCTDCHSIRDWSKYGGPYDISKRGGGGEVFNREMGAPGEFYTKNLTPYHLADWTDGEIFRAVVAGVSKDGSPLFPIMPYENYRQLDREDLYAVIAYLRTLDPVENDVKESSADFPMNFIVHTIPQDAEVKNKRPLKSDTVAYGKYMFTAASCKDCHTQMDQGKPIEGMELAGGMEFTFPDGNTVRSANITPDTETGLGGWTKEAFIGRFRTFSDSTFTPKPLKEGQVNTVMPWIMYSGMTDEDLGAIYDYLRTVKPIKNEVEKFTIHQK